MVQLTMTLMDPDEARACIDRINAAMDTARTLLLELQEREGWLALGYDSWRACAVAEFGRSKTHLYRLIEAARVDRAISPLGEISPLPERHARELAPLLEEPETLREVYTEVQEQTDSQPKASDYRAAVDRRLGIERPSTMHLDNEATWTPEFTNAVKGYPDLGHDEPIADAQGVEHVSHALPFVIPEPEQESEESRAYYALARQRLVVRLEAAAVADIAAEPASALIGFEELERWLSTFIAALRSRADAPIRRVK